MDSPATLRVFGPVPSRRLGRSLGVNNIPGKQCSYSCVYCQAGRTTCLRESREAFYPPAAIRADVQAMLAAARAKRIGIDYVTFVPTGEPTLDAGLGRVISFIKPLGVRVAVFTNGSLLSRQDVREELMLAHWVSVKIDAADDLLWRRMNRPHRRLSFAGVLAGVRAFARQFRGTLATESMLAAGVNDAPAAVNALAREIAALQPATAWLAVPVRPPAESWVRAPDADRFDRALDIFRRCMLDVRPLVDHDEAPWQVIDPEGRQLLALSAVHPLAESELDGILRASGGTREIVEALVHQGRLKVVTYRGQRFYRAVDWRERRVRAAAGRA